MFLLHEIRELNYCSRLGEVNRRLRATLKRLAGISSWEGSRFSHFSQSHFNFIFMPSRYSSSAGTWNSLTRNIIECEWV